MRATPLLLVGLLASVCAPQLADAAGRAHRLAVLPIIIHGPHGNASMSSIFDDVSDAAAFRVGLSLVSNEELFLQREETANRIRECGSDTNCVVRELRAFDARMGLVVTVNLALEPPLISLQLADTDERRMVFTSVEELSPDEGNVSDAIRARVKKMLDEQRYVRAGRIIVDVEPEGAGRAKITLGDSEPDKGTPNVFSVEPGTYPVKAELDGWYGDASEATVGSGEEVRVRLTLEEDTSIFESVWFWSAVGIVAAGATTAAVLVATAPSTRCLCVTIGDSPCPCDPADQ